MLLKEAIIVAPRNTNNHNLAERASFIEGGIC